MSNIIFRGSLTKEKLKELSALQQNQILLERQEDGNWKGYGFAHGKKVEVREAKPEDCLVRILTHE